MPKNINLDLLSRFYDNLKSLFNNKVDKETGKSLSTNDFTTAEKEKLAGIETGANKTVVDSALSSTSTNPVQNKVINTALGNKANAADVYTKTESDSRFLGINGTAVKATADGTGANIADNFASVKSDVAVNRVTLGVQCKNLLKITSPPKNANGVEFTLIDGVITLTGTATKTFDDYFPEYTYSTTESSSWLHIKEKSIFSIYGSLNTISLAYYKPNASTVTYTTVSNNNALSLEKGAIIIGIYIRINADVDYTGKNLSIMLHYADIQDDTYEPYAPSLQEQINALTARISALEGT